MNTFEQTDLFASQTDNGPSAADAFACCSRYRACSDARACLIPELDYSVNCIYRKNLENGRVFAGKNAESYRPEVYQSFVDRYNTLTEDAASLLGEILHYTFIKKRISVSFMLADIPGLLTLEKAGFFRVVKDPEKTVKKYTLSAMIDACGDLIETANDWAMKKVSSENWERRKSVSRELPGVKIRRDELITWMLQFGREAVKRLTDGICYVELNPEKILEFHEFFMDYYYRADYVSHLDVCENDTRFLKQ